MNICYGLSHMTQCTIKIFVTLSVSPLLTKLQNLKTVYQELQK